MYRCKVCGSIIKKKDERIENIKGIGERKVCPFCFEISRIHKKKKFNKKETNYDFFEKFHLEDPMMEHSTNKMLNKPEYRKLFFNDDGEKVGTIEKQFIESLELHIKYKKPVNISINGEVNSGRSEVAQSIALLYQQIFYQIYKKKINIIFCFSEEDFFHYLNKPNKNIIILEKMISKNLSNILKMARSSQKTFIFLNNTKNNTNKSNYLFNTIGRNKNTNEIRVILSINDFNPNTNKRKFLPIGRMYFRIHNNENLRKKLIEKKELIIEKLFKQKEYVDEKSIDYSKIERDMKILTKLCYKKNIRKKDEMQILILEYNLDDNRVKLGGDDVYNKILFEKTLEELIKRKKRVRKMKKTLKKKKENERNQRKRKPLGYKIRSPLFPLYLILIGFTILLIGYILHNLLPIIITGSFNLEGRQKTVIIFSLLLPLAFFTIYKFISTMD